jgi:hypothetical protein
MDDLVVLNPTFNFEIHGAVVLFVEFLLERIAEFLDAILNELGVSAEC